MKQYIQIVISIIVLLITISGFIFSFGKQNQKIEQQQYQLLQLKKGLASLVSSSHENEKKLTKNVGLINANKDSISSLQTWAASNIKNLSIRLDNQKNRLTRSNNRINQYRNIIESRIWNECKN